MLSVFPWVSYRSNNGLITFKGNEYTINAVIVETFLPPLRKWIFSKRIEFAPRGSKFFPSRVDCFSEVDWCDVKPTVYHNNHKTLSLLTEAATKSSKYIKSL